MMNDGLATIWVKSSYSGSNGGQCIEWAPHLASATGAVPVRDSKDPANSPVTFPAASWSGFVTAVSSGDLTRQQRRTD